MPPIASSPWSLALLTGPGAPLDAQGLGVKGSMFMPEIMGPGVGLLDYDRDGDLDIVMPDFGPDRAPRRPRLWRQDGPLQFTEVGLEAGLTEPSYGQGVLVLDFDQDGWPDLLFTNYGQDRLYRNVGTGRFEDRTEALGLAGIAEWSASAAAADIDGDGDLDLVVAPYLALDPEKVCQGSGGQPDYCGPRSFPGLWLRLWIQGVDGRFTEESAARGLRVGTPRHGLGVVIHDFSGDGRPDIYVANDNDPNHLWVQTEGGRFREEGLLRGVALNEDGREEASMGLALEDLDADGRFDLFVTHLDGETNTFYRQVSSGAFIDRTNAVGLGAPSLPFTAFGTVAIDLEADGDLDLLTVNGHVFRGSIHPGSTLGPFFERYGQPGQAFIQDRGRFTARELGPFTERALVGRGLARGDLDLDGHDDVVVSALNAPPLIFLNRTADRGAWLRVAVIDAKTRAWIEGAVVSVRTSSASQMRLVTTQGSYLSSSEPVASFGLGAHRSAEVTVRLPDGREIKREAVPADQVLVVEVQR